MWIVIHITKSKDAAKEVENALASEGILVKIKGVYKQKNENDNYYEILVLESEAEEAKEILVEKGF